MTQEKQPMSTGLMGSRWTRTILVILMAFLLFGGPYLVYVVNDALQIRFLYAGILGAGSVILGLVLMWYLIKSKVIT